jgi:heptosyltransferase-2
LSRTLIIRFGSLGDLCLLAWSLSGQDAAARAAGAPRPRITLAVKVAYAPLMAAVPGVDAVAPLPGPRWRDLWRLAQLLRRERFDTVLDAHGVLRSRLLCLLLGRRPARRIAKDTAARLALLRARRAHGDRPAAAPSPALRRTMLRRFDAVVATAVTPAADATPHGVGPGAALLTAGRGCALRPRGLTDHPRPARIGLAPGAQWDTKRWPSGHWAELLQRLREVTDLPVEIFLGARERAWFAAGPLADAAAAAGNVTVATDLPLPELAQRLGACRVVVTNDSGLLHLAEAAGTPVLALFGPTVRAFGYFPLLPDSRVLERELACRPCSRNGRRPCWRGDLACLAEISPDAVLAALRALPALADAGAPGGPHG